MSRVCWKCYEPKAPTVPHSDSDCIQVLRSRIEAIESKLGAVSQRESATREDAVGVSARGSMEELSQAAAPNLSANYWRSTSEEAQKVYLYHYARACDLAAAVTEWAKSPSWGVEKDNDQLRDIALAFVRGEPLPQKGG